MARVPARDREAFDANWETIRGDDATTVRVIDDGASGVAGWLLAFPSDGELCLGYWIAREQWGRGLASPGGPRVRRRSCRRARSTRPWRRTTSPRDGCWRSAASRTSARRPSGTTALGEDVEIHSFELR